MKALTLRLDDDVYEALRVEAFEKRTTISDLIRAALRRQGPITEEWEYEVTYSGYRNPTSDGFRFRSSSGILPTLDAAREWMEKVPNPVIRRRTKGVEAGPWEPVEAARTAQS